MIARECGYRVGPGEGGSTVSDMASILGLILLAFTWLALRGMGSDQKHRRHARRRTSRGGWQDAVGMRPRP